MTTFLRNGTPAIERLRELSVQLDQEADDLCFFFNHSLDMLAIVNTDGTFIRINSSWQKILGWTDAELQVDAWLHWIHVADMQKVEEIIDGLMIHDVERFHCRMRRNDMSYIVVEFSATRWTNGRSNLVGRVVPEQCLNCPISSPRPRWNIDVIHATKQGD